MKRGLSVHFSIDNDGTIYQMVDTNHIAHQCKPINDISIGVEISNAVYPKYNNYYKHKVGKERKIIKKPKCHGSVYLPEILDFYEEQYEALYYLIQAVCDHYHIFYIYPKNKFNEEIRTIHKPILEGTFSGICCHYNVNRRKSDCCNLNLVDVVHLSNVIGKKIIRGDK